MHQSARHWLAQSLWVPHSLQAVLSSLCKMSTCVGKMEAYRKSPLYFGLWEMRKGSGPERAVPGAVCCCVCKIYTGCLLLQNGHAHIHTEILLVACCVCKSKIAQTNLCRHLNLLNSNIRFSFVAMDTHHWCKSHLHSDSPAQQPVQSYHWTWLQMPKKTLTWATSLPMVLVTYLTDAITAFSVEFLP